MERFTYYLESHWGEWAAAAFTVAAKARTILLCGFLAVRILGIVTNKALNVAKISPAFHQLIQTAIRWLGYLILIVVILGIVLSAMGINTVGWFESTGVLIVRALVFFVLGVALIGAFDKALRKALLRTKVDITLHAFIASAVKAVLFVVLAISCIGILGIDTTSLIAALSAAALALALSVKDHLSNLIGGAVVLFTKPFVVGDYIEMDSYSGIVDEIGLFYTTLKTFDQKKVFIPNNDTAKAKITNHSASPVRRLDMTFQVAYEDDFEEAKRIILSTAEESNMMLSSPSPVVRVCAHGQNAIEIIARIWVNWPDYYDLQFYMLEQVKHKFDKAGIRIPYRQVDVHIGETQVGAPEKPHKKAE